MMLYKSIIIIGIMAIFGEILSLLATKDSHLTNKGILTIVYNISVYMIDIFFATLKIKSVYIDNTALLILIFMNILYFLNFVKDIAFKLKHN